MRLKALAEEGSAAPSNQGLAVNVPFSLAESERHLREGISQDYQNRLISDCKILLNRNLGVTSIIAPADIPAALAAINFHQLD